MVLRCLFRYLTHKVVDDFHFLLFLSIHFLVQHGFVQFLNGSILAAFICSVITSSRFCACSFKSARYVQNLPDKSRSLYKTGRHSFR